MLVESISCLAVFVFMAEFDLLIQHRYLSIMTGKRVSIISDLIDQCYCP